MSIEPAKSLRSVRSILSLRRGSVSKDKQTMPKAVERYGAFISYSREEAGSDARLLRTALATRMQRPVFLDATDADNILEIVTHEVPNAAAVVLLLTGGVLWRPWVLLELYEALRLKIPVVPILVEGRGYDFAAAKAHLGNLVHAPCGRNHPTPNPPLAPPATAVRSHHRRPPSRRQTRAPLPSCMCSCPSAS